MKVLISGGCKNGKSGFAQQLAVKLSGNGARYYVATMIPYDGEDRARVEKHIADRAGMGFGTLEIGTDIARCLENGRNGTFLIDSVTALLTNETFSAEHGWKPDPEAPDPGATPVAQWDQRRFPAFSARFPYRRIRLQPQPGVLRRPAGILIWPAPEATDAAEGSPLLLLLSGGQQTP